MHKIAQKCMATGSAIAIGAALWTTPAHAATTWEVAPGGGFDWFAGLFNMRDEVTGTSLTCQSISASGTAKSDGGHPGESIATLVDQTVNHCTGWLGITFGATFSSPWSLNANSYDASTDSVNGTISGIRFHFTTPGCSADVAGPDATTPGTMSASYSNALGELSLGGGNLHIWNVSGCFGLFASGHPWTISMAPSIVDPPQVITAE
ncbi:hypothetical protein [Actinomadura sp. 9N407]|uniref:hypothetical protein n=1 Tax=Actinomadura sp. 9N407 TaxID=3375154 RepID=UPI0037A45EEC